MHLRQAQILHMACHRYSSHLDPSRSKLLLEDWQLFPLTVYDIELLTDLCPQFAYLSACHTAATGNMNLLDESINLASALIGFFSVVATLWYAVDKHSPNVACEVYRLMRRNGKIDTTTAAFALHQVARGLREATRIIPGFLKQTSSDPLLWAAYIHIGV